MNWALYVLAGLGALFALPLAVLAWVSLMEVAHGRWLEWMALRQEFIEFMFDRKRRKP